MGFRSWLLSLSTIACRKQRTSHTTTTSKPDAHSSVGGSVDHENLDTTHDLFGDTHDNNFDEARGKRLFSSLALNVDLSNHLGHEFWAKVCDKLSRIDQARFETLEAISANKEIPTKR